MKKQFQSLTEKGRWLLATLTLIFTLGIGQMWGDTWTAANMAGDGTHKSNITVSSPGNSKGSTQIWKDGKTAKNEDAITIAADVTSSGNNYNKDKSYIEIRADRGYCLGTSVSLRGGSTQSSNKKALMIVWDNAAQATFNSYQLIELAKKDVASSDGANLDVTIPANMRTARIYRRVKIKDNTIDMSGTSTGENYAAIVSVTATAVLAPEIDGDSQMFNDETITLTGYPSGGSWAVVNGPGEIAPDGKLTAKGNGTITVSYTVGTASGTKNIVAGVTKTFMFDFTGGAMPEVSGFTLTNLSATFDGANGLKMGSDLQGVRISSEVYEFTNALVSAKAGSTSKKVSYNLHDGDQDKTNDPEFATVGTSFAEYNKDIDSQIFTVYRSGGSTTNFNYIVITAKKVATYTVTFNNNGKGGDAPAAQSGITSGGKATEPTEPEDASYNFGGWYNKADWQADGAEKWNFGTSTVTKDTTLYAKWTDKSVPSTDATLNALSVAGCTFNETFDPATFDYTVDLPFYASMPTASAVTATKNDANASDPVVSISGNVISVEVTPESGAGDKKTYTITVTIAATPTASTSVNLEQNVLDNGKTWGYAAALAAANIVVDGVNSLDSLNDDPSKTARNYGFLGLKFNKAKDIIKVVVPASSVLNVKFGNIATPINVTVNGVAQTPIATKTNGTSTIYHLDEAAGVREVIFNLGVASKTVTLQQVKIGADVDAITLPWKVSFDVVGHANAVSPMIWKGTALTLPGVSNVESGYAFEKWNDGSNDYLEGAEYTPTNNVTLTAVYTMTVEDRMAELEFNGVAVEGFSPDVQVYNLTTPYAETLPQITKAVPVDDNANATIQETYWDGDHNYYVAQAYVIPAGGTNDDAKFYQVRFTMDPKLGATIFKAELTAANDADYSGMYADADNSEIALVVDPDNNNEYKFSGKSNYIKMALADATFAEGDVLKMTYTTNPQQGELAIYDGTTKLQGTPYTNNTLTFSDAVGTNKSTLYIRRTDDNKFNGWVAAVEVQRYMAPVIKSFKIGDKVGVFSVKNEKNIIDVEVAWNADVTSLTPTIEAYANGGATLDKTGAQNFSDTVEYNVSSAYAGDGSTKYYVVVTKEPHYVVKIGTMSYTSLEAALEHAADGEIVLLEDLDVTAQVEVAAGVTATIDLAGHKIEYTGTETLPSGVILVHNGASLTINDSSDPDAGKIIAGEKAYAAIAMTKAGDNAANKAILVINGGIFTGNYYAITGHGSRHNTEITINNGTFNATAFEDNNAIYHPQEGTLTINNGTFTGYLSAIEMRAGTLVINGGTFISTATTYSCNPNGSGTTTVGAAIAIAQHNTQKDIAVTINGGTFTGVKAINEANPQGNADPEVEMAIKGGDFTGEVSTVDVDNFISGGTFENEVTEDQCANGYMPLPADPVTGKYGVTPKDPMCLIKVNITGQDAAEVAVGYGETTAAGGISGAVELEVDAVTYTGYKFNTEGAYLEIQLANGNFLAGDSVVIMVTKAQSKPIKIYGAESATEPIYTASGNMTAGKNYAILPVGVNTNKIYLRRLNDSWNPNVAYVAVFRSANPILQKFELAGEAGVINEANKTVAIEVPYATDVTALEPTIHYVSNGDPVAPAVAVSPAGAQDFTSPVVYTITDKDGSATAYTVTVSIAEPSTDATLSALSYGGTAIALEDGVYDYIVNLAKGTTVVPALAATAHSAVAQTPVIDNATEFVNYQATSSVVVTAQDGTTTQTYTVLFKVAHMITDLVDVTENTTWDWTEITARADGSQIDVLNPSDNKYYGPKVLTEDGLILANYVLGGNHWDKIEGNNGGYSIRSSSNKFYQGASLHMHTTVSGYLKIHARNDGNTMTLSVQNAGRDMSLGSLGNWKDYTVYVQAGDVVIYNVPETAGKPMRIDHMEFTVDNTPDYTRTEMLGNGVYGTICLPYNVPAGGVFGVTIYELMGREPQYGKLAFDEIVSGEMEAGVPYVFQAHGDALSIFYGETHVDDPVSKDNGMYGTFTNQTLTDLDDVYYFAQRALWSCDDLTELNLPANRAYVKLSEIDYLTDPNPAPGRRRITMTVNGEKVTTGIGEIETSETPMKVLIDGQIFIIRGEKMFDVTGKLVK